MDWPVFRDEGYLEVTGQGEGSQRCHHVPSELDTRTNSILPASLFDPSSIFAPREIEQLTENPRHPELVISTRSTQVFSAHIAMAGDRPNQQGGSCQRERPVQNSTRPDQALLPTDDPPAANTPTLVPIDLQPTATTCIPDYVKELRRYFMMERPIRTTADSKYIEDLAIRLAEGIFGSSGRAWLDSKKNMKTFCDNARHMLHKFKTIARLTLKDSYNLHIAETWRTSVEPLLIGWDFVDEEVLVQSFPMTNWCPGFFNCCACEHHHSRSHILSLVANCRPSSPPTLKISIVLSPSPVTIIRPEFEADTYEPHYNNALRCIQPRRVAVSQMSVQTGVVPKSESDTLGTIIKSGFESSVPGQQSAHSDLASPSMRRTPADVLRVSIATHGGLP
ncbi:hypothetical protein BKA82DRAFT_28548 [Pisolithus tinctorius]|nr:hypothetical protein BKA82DRAFT_28548 [Pisolithus tinctorius]